MEGGVWVNRGMQLGFFLFLGVSLGILGAFSFPSLHSLSLYSHSLPHTHSSPPWSLSLPISLFPHLKRAPLTRSIAHAN